MTRDYGLPAGLASHLPQTILRLEESGLCADFYHLTLGVPNSFESADRERTLETVRRIDKPMVVFKVIGAGRFNPKVDLPYVLKTIRRKDGLCIGVDNPEQLAENADLVRRLTD
jgi:2'-5' RNA ligase